FVITEPKDAEVVLNGEVRRAEGSDDGLVNLEIPYGSEAQLEVRKRGFRPVARRINPTDDHDTYRGNVHLVPADVMLQLAADTPGAEVFVNDKAMGAVTPTSFRLPSDARRLDLRKRCFDKAEI